MVRRSCLRPRRSIDAAFRNEPPIDFRGGKIASGLPKRSKKFASNSKSQVRKRSSGSWLESVNPADPKEVVGRVRAAGIDQAETAIETAARFFPEWRATPAAERRQASCSRQPRSCARNAGSSRRGKF